MKIRSSEENSSKKFLPRAPPPPLSFWPQPGLLGQREPHRVHVNAASVEGSLREPSPHAPTVAAGADAAALERAI